jgi:hypothetical protein
LLAGRDSIWLSSLHNLNGQDYQTQHLPRSSPPFPQKIEK